MKRAAGVLLGWVGILVLCVPLSILLTLLLLPFWSWVEARHHLESVGHSGPAGWCFLATYLVGVLVTGGVGWAVKRRAI